MGLTAARHSRKFEDSSKGAPGSEVDLRREFTLAVCVECRSDYARAGRVDIGVRWRGERGMVKPLRTSGLSFVYAAAARALLV